MCSRPDPLSWSGHEGDNMSDRSGTAPLVLDHRRPDWHRRDRGDGAAPLESPTELTEGAGSASIRPKDDTAITHPRTIGRLRPAEPHWHQRSTTLSGEEPLNPNVGCRHPTPPPARWPQWSPWCPHLARGHAVESFTCLPDRMLLVDAADVIIATRAASGARS